MRIEEYQELYQKYLPIFGKPTKVFHKFMECVYHYNGIVPIFLTTPTGWREGEVVQIRSLWCLVEYDAINGKVVNFYRRQSIRKNKPREPRPDDMKGRYFIQNKDLPVAIKGVVNRVTKEFWREVWTYNTDARKERQHIMALMESVFDARISPESRQDNDGSHVNRNTEINLTG